MWFFYHLLDLHTIVVFKGAAQIRSFRCLFWAPQESNDCIPRLLMNLDMSPMSGVFIDNVVTEEDGKRLISHNASRTQYRMTESESLSLSYGDHIDAFPTFENFFQQLKFFVFIECASNAGERSK